VSFYFFLRDTSTHQQHISTSPHQNNNTSAINTSNVNTSTQQHINALTHPSTHQHSNTSTHQHINTSTPQRIINFSFKHIESIKINNITRPEKTSRTIVNTASTLHQHIFSTSTQCPSNSINTSSTQSSSIHRQHINTIVIIKHIVNTSTHLQPTHEVGGKLSFYIF